MRWPLRIFILFVIALTGFALWRVALPPLPDNVTRRHVTMDGRDVVFMLAAFPQDAWRWQLAQDTTDPKTLEEWQDALGADVVMNGAYFNDDNNPSGYYRLQNATGDIAWPSEEEQRELSSYSFFVGINDGTLSLAYLPQSPRSEPEHDAFLSFPTLIHNSRSLVKEDSFRFAARTVLATAADGTPYAIITEDGDVTLFELAQWLETQPERFTIAGNLDGGPSTGLYYENGLFDVSVRSTALPNVLAVTRIAE